jgi:hypothetical protein
MGKERAGKEARKGKGSYPKLDQTVSFSSTKRCLSQSSFYGFQKIDALACDALRASFEIEYFE